MGIWMELPFSHYFWYQCNAPYHCCIDLQVPGTKTVHEEQLEMVQSAWCVSLCFFCVCGCQNRGLLSWQYVARPYVCLYVYIYMHVFTQTEWVDMCSCTLHVYICIMISLHVSQIGAFTPFQHATSLSNICSWRVWYLVDRWITMNRRNNVVQTCWNIETTRTQETNLKILACPIEPICRRVLWCFQMRWFYCHLKLAYMRDWQCSTGKR